MGGQKRSPEGELNGCQWADCNHTSQHRRNKLAVSKRVVWRVRALRYFESPRTAFGSGSHLLFEDQCSLCLLFSFLSLFAPTLDPFGQGTEMRCVLHACVSYVFSGTLARRKKTVLGKLAIKIRVRHDTPHSLNRTKRSRPQTLTKRAALAPLMKP